MKFKNKILLIGYSNLARRRLIKTFIKKKILFSVASKSFKKKIYGAYNQFDDYDKALKLSGADLVYLSVPNSMHFKLAKKILNHGYHLIVDKPITTNLGEIKKLIKIANKKKLLLSEAVFYNYHSQFNYLRRFCRNLKRIEQIFVNFTIPTPKANSLLASRKLSGGAIMDMGSYAASIHRLFFKEKIKSKDIIIKRNQKKLVTSFDIFFKYNTKVLIGTFRFGGDYKNNIFIRLIDKSIEVNRLFSPPDDINLDIKLKTKNKIQIIKIKKDNCFENYLSEVIQKIKLNKLKYYHANMIKDENFRLKIISN